MSFDVAHVARVLSRSGVHLIVLRVGSARDRLWREINGSVRLDPKYRPALRSIPLAASLARALGGRMYSARDVSDATAAVRTLVRSSRRTAVGRTDREIALGPYAALGGLILVALVFGPVLPLPWPTRVFARGRSAAADPRPSR